MDFILQELFREVNTLSVKIEKPDLKDLALTMKLKVEELRETGAKLRVNEKFKSLFDIRSLGYRKIYFN